MEYKFGPTRSHHTFQVREPINVILKLDRVTLCTCGTEESRLEY